MSNRPDRQPQNDNNPPDLREKLIAAILARGASVDIQLTQGLPEEMERLGVSPAARDSIRQRIAAASLGISALEGEAIRQVRAFPPLLTPEVAGEMMGILEIHAGAFERQARTPEQVKQAASFRQTVSLLGRLLPEGPTPPDAVPLYTPRDFTTGGRADPKQCANDRERDL